MYYFCNWKLKTHAKRVQVRRAAAKALAALIIAFPDALPALHAAAAQELVGRFKEREESVRGDVFWAYIALVRQVGMDAWAVGCMGALGMCLGHTLHLCARWAWVHGVCRNEGQ